MRARRSHRTIPCPAPASTGRGTAAVPRSMRTRRQPTRFSKSHRRRAPRTVRRFHATAPPPTTATTMARRSTHRRPVLRPRSSTTTPPAPARPMMIGATLTTTRTSSSMRFRMRCTLTSLPFLRTMNRSPQVGSSVYAPMSGPLTQATMPPLNQGPWMNPPTMSAFARPAGGPMVMSNPFLALHH